MRIDAAMDSYAARLASFNATLTTQKKRASDAKGAKTLKWPRAAPSITQLAKAGFFYKPTPSNPDNATCYLCHCNLDGWEEEDEPIVEHLKHSPSCGWANVASVEQAVENGERDLENPSSQRLVQARTMTFGSMWPHESKKGWVCKIKKMVEAGWHYCPTLESDDFVRCAYCNLSLDGWEPKDNPHDEHQRRSPDCLFFSLSAPSSNVKTSKAKKSRTSKASRMSSQSALSVASEISSLVDNDLHNESVEPIVEVVKPVKGGKKGLKGKKAKTLMLMPTEDETQAGSSFVEPEDDDFEVKVAQPVASKAKSKKRKSEEITEAIDDPGRTAPKRRRTTIRDSIANVSGAHEELDESIQPMADRDSEMADLDNKTSSSKPESKKSKKGGKKRGSQSARKASSKSTASEASLRAGLPNDDDIDAALAEDLDRPLTDNGEDEEFEVSEPPNRRRLTRSKVGTKTIEASTAPTRRNTRNSAVIIDNSVCEPPTISSLHEQSAAQPSGDVQEPTLEALSVPKTKKKTGTRKASAKQKPRNKDPEPEEEVPEPAAEEETAVISKQTRGRKISESDVSHSPRVSNGSKLDVGMNLEDKFDDSMRDPQIPENDSGLDTDANAKGRSKRGKKAFTAKKPAGGKRTGPKARNVEDAVSEAVPNPSNVEPEGTTVSVSKDDHAQPEETVAGLKKPIKKQNRVAKSKTKSKGSKTALTSAEDGEDARIVDEREKERLIDPPTSPIAASAHSTPKPAPSPQSSDAENQPPSSRPSQSRPPLSFESPLRSQEFRVPLAVIATPSASPSRNNPSKLRSTFPWTAIDLEHMLHGTPDAGKENLSFANGAKKLTSPEKSLTVEEWIMFNAERGEAKLRNDCERVVGKFEDQGVRALKTLEGIICVD